MPWVFFFVAALRYKDFWIGVRVITVVALIFVFPITYLAMRAKEGIERCPKNTLGYIWADIYAQRVVLHLLILMFVLLFSGIIWFVATAVLIYLFEMIFTLAALRRQGCKLENELNRAPGQPIEPEEK